MGARAASTTRANTSTSTAAAPARSSARAQASMVAGMKKRWKDGQRKLPAAEAT